MRSLKQLLDLNRDETKDIFLFLCALNLFFLLCMFSFPAIASHVYLSVKIACGIGGVLSAIAFIRRGAARKLQAERGYFRLLLLASVFLGILTGFAFYKPMLDHFWIGFDEPVLLSFKTPWIESYDTCCARPLAGLEAFLGNILVPGSIDSLPIVLALERWILATGVFLFLITLLPAEKLFAIASGVLMVVNPAETLRFAPALSIPYGGALIFFVFASFVFVLSYRAASRALLMLSCVLLGVAFLHYETMFPMSVIVPLLLWLSPPQPERRLWAAAWYLTTLAAFFRFGLLYFLRPLYQSSYKHFGISSLADFPLLLKPILKFVSPIYSDIPIALPPIVIGAATLIALIALSEYFPLQSGVLIHRRKMAVAAATGLVGVGLALLPEISVPAVLRGMPNADSDLTLRLEFSPGPFQAIIWAAAIAWASSYLPRAQYFYVAGIAIVVTLSTLDSWHLQATRGTLNSYMDFQKESDIFRSAAPIIRQSPADAVIFFVIPDDRPSPLGFGYHPFHMSCLLFGRPAYAGHFSSDLGLLWRATALPSPLDRADNYFELPEIKDLVVLTVEPDGHVTEVKGDVKVRRSALERRNSVNNMGQCTIPMAGPLWNGDLPFLLSSR